LIENRIIAIISAILTFIAGTTLSVFVIFYFGGYPLSSIYEHQLYVFFAVLIGVILASFVYGRGSNERAIKAQDCVGELLEVELKTKDMWRILRGVEQLPPFVIKDYISMNINFAKEYEEGIKRYRSKLTEENLAEIEKIIDKPVPQLQRVLNELYKETDMEQFKILADPSAEELITMNLKELKTILFPD
jgi:hypothetical protein